MMVLTTIVSHSEDIDGVGAQAMLRAHYRDLGVPLTAPVLITPSQLRDELLDRTTPNVGRVVVADLALSEAVLSDDELTEFAAMHELVVFDHHEVVAERTALLARLCRAGGIVSGECASKQVLRTHHAGDETFGKIAEAAHATDFNVMGSAYWLGSKLNALIAHSDVAALGQLVLDLADHKVLGPDGFTAEYQARWEEANAQDTAALAQMRTESRLVDCSGLKTAIGAAPGYVGMKLGLATLAFTGSPDIGCLLSYDTASVCLVAYRRDLDVDLTAFCRAKGGGGRDNAGGYHYRETITRENASAVMDEALADLTAHVAASHPSPGDEIL